MAPPNRDIVRYREVRRADQLDDQKTALQILAAHVASGTQEELQEFVLSQVKRIIHGDAAGNWYDNFNAGGAILSLEELSTLSLTPSNHRTLRQLIHFIDDGPAGGFATGAVKQILPSANPFPTSVIWWEDALLTKRIVDKIIVRNPNKTPATVQWRMYDVDGTTVLETVTDTYAYSGIFEISRTRAIV